MKLKWGIFKSAVSFILALSLGIGMVGSRGFAISDEEKADVIKQAEQYLKDKNSLEKILNELSKQSANNAEKDDEAELVDPDEVDKFLEKNKNYFPDKEIFKLRKELSKLTRKEFLRVKSLNFKSPLIMLFVSIFLGTFGLDRFLLEDAPVGTLKLGSFITFCLGRFGLFTFAMSIFDIVDWFLVKGNTREYNLKMVLEAIGES